jgi:hypothetical protein
MKFFKHLKIELDSNKNKNGLIVIVVSLLKAMIVVPLFLVPKEVRKYIWRSLYAALVLGVLMIVFSTMFKGNKAFLHVPLI